MEPLSAIPLIHTDRLDPRPAHAIDRLATGTVNIPAGDLATRSHELPDRTAVVRVLSYPGGEADAERAVLALRATGRSAVVEPATDRDRAAWAPFGGGWRLWAPHPLLVDWSARLAPGVALDLACGAGREAVYLASAGWRVTGVDHLPDALALASGLAARHLPDSHRPRWVTADIESSGFEPEGGPFDLIVGFRFLHRPLFGRMRGWLRPGGIVIWATYTESHRRRHGKPARDAHVLREDELPRLLGDWRVFSYERRWRGGAHFAEIVAGA